MTTEQRRPAGPYWKRKRFWIGGSGIVALVGIGLFTSIPLLLTHGPAVGAGASAQLACAGVFLMNRDLDEIAARDLRRLNPLTAIADLSVDREARTVTASVWGLAKRSAYYRPGVGCALMIDTDTTTLDAQVKDLRPMAPQPMQSAWPLGDEVDLVTLPDSIDPAALNAAMDRAFVDPTPEGHIDTRALVVVYDGRIVGERYAPGFDKDTRFLSWSASKSVTNALIGTLVADRKLVLDAPAPVLQWQQPGDTRHGITLRHLLNMTSGLEFAEEYVPGDDSTVMLFERADMADYAASRPLVNPPGTQWSYSSGTTNILSRIVRDAAGGTLERYTDYARRRLFEPAGMTSAVFEPDASGVAVGSSYLYLTARDWARFGLLFLNDGSINGRQVLPPEWVAFSRQPIDIEPQHVYGAQFWLNLGNPAKQIKPMFDRCPPDMYMALGHNTQVAAIVPSKRAVIIRLGWTSDDYEFDVNGIFSAILAALDGNSIASRQP